MFKTNKDGLIVDAANGELVGMMIDSFVTALGEGRQADLVIVRLHHQDWSQEGPRIPRNQVHQFALPAHRAAELGRHLLELAAQAEKEQTRPPAH